MVKETEGETARRIFDGRGSREGSCQEYFANKIASILWWLEVTRERFKLSDMYFLLKGRL